MRSFKVSFKQQTIMANNGLPSPPIQNEHFPLMNHSFYLNVWGRNVGVAIGRLRERDNGGAGSAALLPLPAPQDLLHTPLLALLQRAPQPRDHQTWTKQISSLAKTRNKILRTTFHTFYHIKMFASAGAHSQAHIYHPHTAPPESYLVNSSTYTL